MTTTHEAPPRTETAPPQAPPRRQAAADESVSHLVQQASGQIAQLARQELRLAQLEMQQKGKRFGIGGGMFGGAGVLGFIALQALAATAIVAIDLVLPLWLAALVVTGGLAVIAGVLALVGKSQIGKATPPTPERTVESLKADVAEVKERSHR
ncbi:phage holin family protein [Streptomyces oryzae]|uniref:Phage holin family protein n=1 Tax=Streptomyces oryzae TaxID=1434886 RepID=A0ABS3XJT5_9ACTN|nr:phage holin family protein [Streptomyces oryzae]MBO8195656.1 phage holin family protein [Streptomyces oryzae]